MRFYAALVLLLSVGAALAADPSDNGSNNGVNNAGSGNGNKNGNDNNGSGNGNKNGVDNSGDKNGVKNGNKNDGSKNGNNNGVDNAGSGNGGKNGNSNKGDGNGNGNGVSNTGNNNGVGNGNRNGGVKGDPIITGFDGRNFEFFGESGRTYSLVSEKTQGLAMKLKEGHMWDHDGSYVSGLGFQYQEHTVVVENEGDALRVSLDGEQLVMGVDENEMEHILGLATGEMQLLWQLHRPGLGNAVEITTDLLNIIAWVTPAGTRDEGGKVQPAYLNFDVSLLMSPAHNALEGILGRTFNQPEEENDFKFHGVEAEYELQSYFETSHPKCLFGKASAGHTRRLIESGRTLSYPIRASLAHQ